MASKVEKILGGGVAALALIGAGYSLRSTPAPVDPINQGIEQAQAALAQAKSDEDARNAQEALANQVQMNAAFRLNDYLKQLQQRIPQDKFRSQTFTNGYPTQIETSYERVHTDNFGYTTGPFKKGPDRCGEIIVSGRVPTEENPYNLEITYDGFDSSGQRTEAIFHSAREAAIGITKAAVMANGRPVPTERANVEFSNCLG